MSRQDDPMLDMETPGVAEEARQTPLMAGLLQPEGLPPADGADPGETRGAGSLLTGGTLLILMVAAIAAGALFLMRSNQGAKTSATDKAVEAKIEQALSKLSNSKSMDARDPLAGDNMQNLFKDTSVIVGMFTDDHARRQVPLEFLKKDPFAITSLNPVAEVTTVGDSAAARSTDALRLERELAGLKLEAVMEGRVPVAIINGNLVQVGQAVGNFQVKAIAGLGVTLEAAGQTYVLKMEVRPDTNNRRLR